MPSAWAGAVRWMLRGIVRPLFMRGDYVDWRRRMVTTPAPLGVHVVPARLGGVDGEWLVPADTGATILYYLHGGGFVVGGPPLYRRMVGTLAARTGARAFLPDYRLAPEHPFPAAIDDCVAGYRALVGRGVSPSDIVVAGDSAGGALALSMLVALRDAGDPLPAAAALLSPVTDLTLSGESMRTRVADEVLLAPEWCHDVARLYLSGADARAASPLFAELRGLPPLLVQVGTHELLLDDARRFAAAARAAAVAVRLVEWEALWHVFPMFVSVPESRRALDMIAAFALAHAGAPADALDDEPAPDALWAPERA